MTTARRKKPPGGGVPIGIVAAVAQAHDAGPLIFLDDVRLGFVGDGDDGSGGLKRHSEMFGAGYNQGDCNRGTQLTRRGLSWKG